MKKSKIFAGFCLVLGIAILFSPTSATAATVPISIFGTGQATAGSVDPHYQLIASADSANPGPNAYVCSSLDSAGYWAANSSGAHWIGPVANPNVYAYGTHVGTYTYRTTFDLTGLDPSTAVLSGALTADDSVSVLLNGNSTGISWSNFNALQSFSINSGFRTGTNTLDFVTYNGGGPTGLQVAISGTANTTPPPHQTYAILVGSNAPSDNPLGSIMQIKGGDAVDKVASKYPGLTQNNIWKLKYNWNEHWNVKQDITDDLNAIKSIIQPGDSLLFYYEGHGEGPADSNSNADSALRAENNSEGGLSASDLTALLGSEKLKDVRKTVILDACHSGGFWKNPYDQTEFLSSLQNISFFASAQADKQSSVDPDGIGYFTGTLLPLSNAAKKYYELGRDITNAQNGNTPIYGYYADFGYGLMEWNPAIQYSADFNLDSTLDPNAVPEPSTLVLLGMGIIGWIAYTRR